MNQSTPLIDPTTDEKTKRFWLSRDQVPARLSASGLAGGETIALRAIDGPNGIATPVYQDGEALTMNPTRPQLGIVIPGMYEVAKPATAGDVGVFLTQQ